MPTFASAPKCIPWLTALGWKAGACSSQALCVSERGLYVSRPPEPRSLTRSHSLTFSLVCRPSRRAARTPRWTRAPPPAASSPPMAARSPSPHKGLRPAWRRRGCWTSCGRRRQARRRRRAAPGLWRLAGRQVRFSPPPRFVRFVRFAGRAAPSSQPLRALANACEDAKERVRRVVVVLLQAAAALPRAGRPPRSARWRPARAPPPPPSPPPPAPA